MNKCLCAKTAYQNVSWLTWKNIPEKLIFSRITRIYTLNILLRSTLVKVRSKEMHEFLIINVSLRLYIFDYREKKEDGK